MVPNHVRYQTALHPDVSTSAYLYYNILLFVSTFLRVFSVKISNLYIGGRTKRIDKETKPERNYVIVKEHNDNVTAAKLKSIKG